MKKLINDPYAVVDEMVDGFVSCHADLVRLVEPRVIGRRQPQTSKVGLVIGGGSGHEPAFAGYVGVGLADVAVVGHVFTAPPPGACLLAIRAADRGRGVVLIYGNYAGDVLNFSAAQTTARNEGLDVRTVRVSDDVASASRSEASKRRGIAGDVFVVKAAGASAERGNDIDDVVRLAEKANAATRSMGVGLTPCEVPGSGSPTFQIDADAMEVGLGVHGEPGVETAPLASADVVAQLLVDRCVDDLGLADGDRVGLLVNGLGATSRMDLYVLYRGARSALAARNLDVGLSYVGEFVTSLEMGGASVSVIRLDEELEDVLRAPARAVALCQ
jgi:dihydroxyacetone kinase-like protein